MGTFRRRFPKKFDSFTRENSRTIPSKTSYKFLDLISQSSNPLFFLAQLCSISPESQVSLGHHPASDEDSHEDLSLPPYTHLQYLYVQVKHLTPSSKAELLGGIPAQEA